MREVAPGVHQITGFPPNAINAWLIGDVLIDAGTRGWTKKLLRQLANRAIRLVALTHVHADHQGAAHAICEHFNCPLACHEADRAAMEGREPMYPRNRWIRFSTAIWAGPPHPVDRVLREGDAIADIRVVEAPGHTPGHVIFFRDSDRLAIVGDVLANMNLITTIPGLHEPPAIFTHDPAENRRSIRKLAALDPATILFGHGPPLRDATRLRDFVERNLAG